MRCARLVRSLAILAMLAPALVSDAQADPVVIHLEFTARGTFGPLQDVFGVPIAIGDMFPLRLVYDAGVPDINPDPNAGVYRTTGSLIFDVGSGLTLPVDTVVAYDQTFDPSPNMDDLFGTAAFTTAYPGFESLSAELDLRGGGRVGDALPTSNAEVARFFTQGGLRFTGFKIGVNAPFDSGTHELAGTVAVVPDPVPEPGTLLLVASALALALARSKWRTKPTSGSR